MQTESKIRLTIAEDKKTVLFLLLFHRQKGAKCSKNLPGNYYTITKVDLQYCFLISRQFFEKNTLLPYKLTKVIVFKG
ncbi:MAG: hypothetical protein DWB56_12665 [Candidatus Jettenia sp.]|nr:hypothetical protein [Candidatus Jettenia sp.]